MAEHRFDPECPICIAERNAIQAAVDTMNEPGKLREATSAREMLRACIDPDCGQTEGHGPDCALDMSGFVQRPDEVEAK